MEAALQNCEKRCINKIELNMISLCMSLCVCTQFTVSIKVTYRSTHNHALGREMLFAILFVDVMC